MLPLLTTLFFALQGLLATERLYSKYPDLSQWWGLSIWLCFYIAFALLFIVLLLIIFLLLPKKDPSPRTRDFCHNAIKPIIHWVLLMLGYRIHTDGTTCLPDRPYLLVCNHRSAFDPLCTIAALENDALVFVAKPGVFKIPVIGTVMRRLCFLPIDRENARNAVTTIKRAAELIRDVGLSVGIYPEGTRSKDGALLPFHAGSFKIAKLADCPIVVATIRYQKGLLPWTKWACLHIVDVMNEDYVRDNNTATLSERALENIRKDLDL